MSSGANLVFKSYNLRVKLQFYREPKVRQNM